MVMGRIWGLIVELQTCTSGLPCSFHFPIIYSITQVTNEVTKYRTLQKIWVFGSTWTNKHVHFSWMQRM